MIRICLTETVVPEELVSLGLTRVDSGGRVQAALADSWTMFEKGARWRFHLRPNLSNADGKPLTETAIVAVLRSSRARHVYLEPPRRISVESGAIVFLLKRGDRDLPRRLAHPEAGVDRAGPFMYLEACDQYALLVPNPHSLLPARPDTLIFFLDVEIGRGAYEVEAGRADITPVDDEELARLQTDSRWAGRLVAGATRDVHLLVSNCLDRRALLALRQAVNRAAIAAMLFNRRAEPLGASRPLTESERRALPPTMELFTEDQSPAAQRVKQRLVYDLQRSGVTVREYHSPSDPACLCRYLVRPENDLPANAAPLLAVTPYWLVGERVRNFSAPRAGWPGLAEAEAQP